MLVERMIKLCDIAKNREGGRKKEMDDFSLKSKS